MLPMVLLSIVSFLKLIISGSYGTISSFISSYGYVAVFVLMVMESSTIPVPSEIILPLAGYFIAKGVLSFPLVIVVAVIGSIVGSLVDYAVGYYIGKDIVYKHLRFFHIKKEQLDSFDAWFEKNGLAMVFFTRLLPVVRTIVNFPAGFAKMSLKTFILYSIIGILVWDIALTAFGFYVLSVNSGVVVLAGIGAFAILLYVVYRLGMKRMKR